MGDIPSFTALGVGAPLFGLMLWWIMSTRADLKQAREDLLRCQAEKEDLMRDYMRKPHEFAGSGDV